VLGLRWSEVDLPRRTARLADTTTDALLRPLFEAACAAIQFQARIDDIVFVSRSGQSIVGHPKMRRRSPSWVDCRPVSRCMCCVTRLASLAADLGYN
jgi:hypothetical protein